MEHYKARDLIVRISSVSLSSTYIRINIHKLIALRFLVESDVNVLCGWTQVSLVLYFPSDTLSSKT